MLPFLCALAVTQGSVEFQIPVRNMRASRLAEMLRGSNEYPRFLPAEAQVVSDDERSVVTVRGSGDVLLEATRFAKLVDVPHPMVRLKMHVSSPVDRCDYDVSAGLQSGQMWHMSESMTGMDVGLTPRLSADGSCTLLCEIRHDGGRMVTVFRIKPRQTQTLVLGKKVSAEVYAQDGSRTISLSASRLPSLSFSFTAEKPYEGRR